MGNTVFKFHFMKAFSLVALINIEPLTSFKELDIIRNADLRGVVQNSGTLVPCLIRSDFC